MSNQAPSEVVFSLSSTTEKHTDDLCVFRYDHGPVKLKAAPRKRGRPKKCNTSDKIADISISPEDSRSNKLDSDLDFIPVTRGKTADDQDELRRVIRKRVMATHLREKKRKKSLSNIAAAVVPATRNSPITSVLRFDSVDPFDTTPFKMEGYMYDLLKYYSTSVSKALYSIEEKARFNPMAEYWLPMAFHDSALLHVFIGFADFFIPANNNNSNNNAGTNNYGCGNLGVKHLNEAISIVNRRVSADVQRNGVSNATLVAIATIAIIQKSSGLHDQWRAHMKGLTELVHARGGLSSLAAEPLIIGILYRADLYGSIDAFHAPYFSTHSLPSLSLPPLPANNNQLRCKGFQRLDETINLGKTVRSCISCLENAIDSIWSLHSGKSSNAAETRFWITAVQYTLLSPSSSDTTSRTAGYDVDNNTEDGDGGYTVREIIRLVILLYTAAMIDERPPGTPSCDMLVTRLREMWILLRLEAPGQQADETKQEEETKYAHILGSDFKLWTMFIAASVASPGSFVSGWCLTGMLNTAAEMQIPTWESALEMMRERFLPMCDVRCERVWNLAWAVCLAT